MLVKKIGELLIENRLISTDQLEGALREQKLRKREYTLLRAIGRQISAGMPLDQLLAAVADETGKMFEADTVKIYLREEERDLFLLRHPDPRYQTEEVVVAGDDPLIARLLETKAVLIDNDFIDESESGKNFIRHNPRSVALVPLLNLDDVVGFMMVSTREPGTIPEDDAELLRVVGCQVGISVLQSRYLTSRSRVGDFLLQQGVIEMEQLTDALNDQQNAVNKLQLLLKFVRTLCAAERLENVLDRLADVVCRTLDVRTLAVYLADAESERYFCAAERGIERIVGGAFEFSFEHPLIKELEEWIEPIVIPDPAVWGDLADHPMFLTAKQAVALPLPAVKRLAGVVFALLAEPREIDAAELDLAATFCAQAGVLVENHQMVEERNKLGVILMRRGAISREQLDEVLRDQEAYNTVTDYLRATSRRVSRMDSVAEMLDAIAEESAKLLKNDSIVIYLGDRELHEFVRVLDWSLERGGEDLESVFEGDGGRASARISFEHPLAEKLFEDHDAIVSGAVQTDPVFAGVVSDPSAARCLLLPILARNVVVGFLLSTGDAETEFVRENLPLLFTLLSDVGIAIETMRSATEKRKLGRILVDQGVISEDQMKTALKKQFE